MNNTRLKQLDQLLKQQPKDPFLWHAMGVEYSKGAQWDEARNCFARAIALDEKHVGSYYHLGRAYTMLHAPEKARDAYKKGIRIATEVGDLHARGELQTVLMLIEEDLEE